MEAAAGATEVARPRARRTPSAEGRDERRPARTAGSGTRSRNATKLDLQKDLRDFASARPAGWNHEDWLVFLESLKERGHNINDRDAIGLALERERLDLALSRVKGIGPQRRRALIERYGNVWSLRTADPDEVAKVAGIKRELAERVLAELG